MNTKKITAESARILSFKYQSDCMDSLYTRIEESAKKGKRSIYYDFPLKLDLEDREKIKTQLESDGYTVKRNSGFDPRDGGSWDSLVIEW